MNDEQSERLDHLTEIAAHLKAGMTITPDEALKQYGCGRLAARIYDLRQQGLDIHTNHKPVIKANGRKGRVAEYQLVAAA